MSTKLSFKEALERQGVTKAEHPVESASRDKTNIVLFAASSIERPVDFVRLLVAGGVSMKRARAVLDRLAQRNVVPLDINTDSLTAVFDGMHQLGVIGDVLESGSVDAKAIREKQGLSQPDFACLYGLEVNTLKNWEQNRYVPDSAAQVLLRVIEHCPHAVVWARASQNYREFARSVWAFDQSIACTNYLPLLTVCRQDQKSWSDQVLHISGDISANARSMWRTPSDQDVGHRPKTERAYVK